MEPDAAPVPSAGHGRLRTTGPDSGAVYDVVPCGPEFRAPALELLAELWSPDPAVNDAYMRWKYDANPYSSGSVHVALHNGRVVGFRGSCGCRWEFGDGSPIGAVMMADAVVARGHRRRGLFQRLAEAQEGEGAAYVLVTSAGAPARLGLERKGWGSIGPIARRALDRRGRSRVRLHRRPFTVFDRVLRWQRGRLGRGVRGSATARPAAMADLVARLPVDGRLRHTRDLAYFAWRFGNPLSLYRFLFLGSDRLEGYLVLQADAFARYGRRVSIADWEATTPDGLSALLRAALPVTRGWPLSAWVGSNDNTRDDILRSLGFVEHAPRSPQDYYPTILLRPVGAGPPPARPWRLEGVDLLDPGSWDPRMLYSDGC